ncbi:MAG: PIN domain-containing protein [Planctomycetota bacterium]
MSRILVDTSVWVDYFKGGPAASRLDGLIDDNLVCVNDMILAELVPPLRVQKADAVVALMGMVAKVALVIDWDEIIAFQVRNIQAGINKVGIPDLIIMQNAIRNDLTLFTLDNHFHLMRKLFKLKQYK